MYKVLVTIKSQGLSRNFWLVFNMRIQSYDYRYLVAHMYIKTFTRGADKSLAQPGRKQARKHVRYARDFNNIEMRAVKFFLSC